MSDGSDQNAPEVSTQEDSVEASVLLQSLWHRHHRLAEDVETRIQDPPNLQRSYQLAANAEAVEHLAATDPIVQIRKRIHALENPGTKAANRQRPLAPPEDLPFKMEEVTPQMTLRPIPRVEREPPDELPFEAAEYTLLSQTQNEVEGIHQQVCQTIRPQLVTVWNLDIMIAHRRFHQSLLHRTDWSEYLSADRLEAQDGPLWRRKIWERWDTILDPIPHEDRAMGSGYLFNEDNPIPMT